MAFAIASVVRGYHVYKDIWDAEINSELPCFREPDNREDRYAVAVMNGTVVVGHVPRRISYICNIFLRHSGSIICRVTGPRQYSRDLESGGLEVPCELRFYSNDLKCIKKSKELLERALYATTAIENHLGVEVSSSTSITTTSGNHPVELTRSVDVKEGKKDNGDHPGTVKLLDQTMPTISEKLVMKGNKEFKVEKCSKEWLRIGGIKLTLSDREAIVNGQKLNDLAINVAQKLLRMQFPNLKGFQSTLLQEKKSKSTFEKHKVQIIHSHGNHWIVAATIEATSYEVKVYDSAFDNVDNHTAIVITNLFGSLAKSKTVKIPKQSGTSDCGLYAIANATALCFGKDPAILYFNQALMRLHLVQCMEQKTITPFPLQW